MTDDSECRGTAAGAAPRPENEFKRLEALRALDLIGRPIRPELNDLTVLASHICETPIALITLLEEEYQWYGAKIGVGDLCGTPRDVAFCTHAILQSELFVVPDALADQRFALNPLVTAAPYIRFYAGMPLITEAGHALGTLCVIDRTPRQLTPKQELGLRVLSRQVVTQLELWRSQQQQRKAEEELQLAYDRLERRVQDRTREWQSAHDRLELAIRASSIGLWEWNLETNTLFHSPEAKAQLGYLPEEIPSDDWAEWRSRIHPEDWERVDSTFVRYFQDPSSDFECEARLRHRDGSYRWIFGRARATFGPQGQPLQMLGCHIDLTERRVMEEHLQHSREQLRALAAHLHTAREEETGRIARELHDELGSNLTGLKLDVGWLDRQLARLFQNGDAGAVRDRLRAVSELIDKTIASVRKVCSDLRPPMLDELGLGAAIDWLANEFETRRGIACRVRRPEAMEIEPAMATVLFRVTQELLTNVARHSGASSVQVALQDRDQAWELIVTDDGRGLPPDALARRDRFGLMGLRERVLAAGGRVDFAAPESGGTQVTICLPCIPKARS